jgi:hypothetical protein
MNNLVLVAFVMSLLCFAYGVVADSPNEVNIDVAGYINHGPMQPTIKMIKEVTSKYDDRISVNWVDLGSEEGQKYFNDHDLSAHLNILINGNYKYKLDGNEVTFQWFEGQNWTKEDLDSVISDILAGNGKAVPVNG